MLSPSWSISNSWFLLGISDSARDCIDRPDPTLPIHILIRSSPAKGVFWRGGFPKFWLAHRNSMISATTVIKNLKGVFLTTQIRHICLVLLFCGFAGRSLACHKLEIHTLVVVRYYFGLKNDTGAMRRVGQTSKLEIDSSLSITLHQ